MWGALNERGKFDAAMAGLLHAGVTKEDFDFAMILRPMFPAIEHAGLMETALSYQAQAMAHKALLERLDRKDKVLAAQGEARAAEAKKLEFARRQLALKQVNDAEILRRAAKEGIKLA